MKSNEVLQLFACLLSGILGILALNDSNDLRLTVGEKHALDKFKFAVEDSIKENFMKNDFYLIRWLRRAHLSIPNARNLLFQTIKWRERNNISKITSENWSDLEDNFPLNFEGHDKMGRPVLAVDFGDWDLRAAVIHGNIRRLQRYLTYSTEKIFQKVFEAQQATGKPVTRSVILVNADGLNIRQHGCPLCIGFLVQWIVDKEAFYPYVYDETIIFNAPPIGTVILNACRAVMSLEQRSQTKTFDGNKKAWMRYLDEKIERNERSPRYGGTREQW